jgi:membrane fusion protein (multidrug efflux system)
MIKRLVIVVLALGILFGGIFGWKAFVGYQMRKAIASAKPPAVVVSSARVEEARWQASVTSVGSLRANQGVEVSAEVAGTVAAIAFESGGRIAAGELLVQLDASKEEADLRSLEAQLELARLDYERARSLLRNTAVSQSQLDRAKSVLDSLAAQVDAQRATIAKKAIRAPFQGELGIRQIDLGQYLSAGSEIVTLQSLDPILVDFTVPERHLPALAVGQQVQIEVAAFPGKPFVGAVTAISPKVDEETRNVPLRATFANADGRLRPGMFARVAVLTGGLDRVLTLPRSAISFFPYGDSVFVIQGEGEDLVVERRQVTTGRIREGRVEIVEGLSAGDHVVSAGQLKLRSGQQIRIDNSVVPPSGVTRG